VYGGAQRSSGFIRNLVIPNEQDYAITLNKFNALNCPIISKGRV
jgi:hypothetical protein